MGTAPLPKKHGINSYRLRTKVHWRRKRISVWRDSSASKEKRLKQNARCKSSKNCRVIQLSRNPLPAKIRSTSLPVAGGRSALDARLERQRNTRQFHSNIAQSSAGVPRPSKPVLP